MLDEFLNALKDLAQTIWDQLKVLKHLPSLDSFNDFWKQSLSDPKTYGLFAGGLMLLAFLVYRLRRNQTIKRRRMIELTEALEDDQDYTTSIMNHETREDPLIAELKTQLELPVTPSDPSQANEIEDGIYEEDLPSEFFEDLDGLKEEVSANPDKFEEIEEPAETASEPASSSEENVLTFEATPENVEPKASLKESSEKPDIDLEFKKLEEELLKPEELQETQPEEAISDSPVPPVVQAEALSAPAQASPEEEPVPEKSEEPMPPLAAETQQRPKPFLLPLEAIVEEPSPAPEQLSEPLAEAIPESSPEPVADPLPEPTPELEPLPDPTVNSFSPEDDSLPTLQTLENLQNEIEKTIKNLSENDDAFKEDDEKEETSEPVVSFRDPEQIIQKLEAFGESLENKINALPNPSSDDNEILIDTQSPIAEIPTPPKKAVTMEVLESFLFIPKNKESDS